MFDANWGSKCKLQSLKTNSLTQFGDRSRNDRHLAQVSTTELVVYTVGEVNER
jgi:hypothetical protein